MTSGNIHVSKLLLPEKQDFYCYLLIYSFLKHYVEYDCDGFLAFHTGTDLGRSVDFGCMAEGLNLGKSTSDPWLPKIKMN